MDVTRRVMIATARSGELKTPLNQFARIRTLIDPDVKDVVRISRNSLWSHGFVDLQDEPYVYSQPDTKGRFIVMQALNMWTDDFASSGSRTTGTERGNFALQDELELTPLSAWGAPYSPPHDDPIDATVDTTAIPFDQLRMMRGTTFFKRLAGLLVDARHIQTMSRSSRSWRRSTSSQAKISTQTTSIRSTRTPLIERHELSSTCSRRLPMS
jgi:hypothetical protein